MFLLSSKKANASFPNDRNGNDTKKSPGLRHTDTSGCKMGGKGDCILEDIAIYN